MKKILLILTIILTFASCCSEETMNRQQYELKRQEQNLSTIDNSLYKVEFSGHSYIIFYKRNTSYGDSAVFMLHDPDCRCQ